jgi:hypothetical protein
MSRSSWLVRLVEATAADCPVVDPNNVVDLALDALSLGIGPEILDPSLPFAQGHTIDSRPSASRKVSRILPASFGLPPLAST